MLLYVAVIVVSIGYKLCGREDKTKMCIVVNVGQRALSCGPSVLKWGYVDAVFLPCVSFASFDIVCNEHNDGIIEVCRCV